MKARGGNPLFSAARERIGDGAPLAERMRPRTLEDVAGQTHLLRSGSFLARAIEADRVPSMILWGPPGCGKTTLARVVAERTKALFVPYSAVAGSVPELRLLLGEARDRRDLQGERTLLFIDEIHRFHKGQQDALLPDVERGNVVLIGATTENPSFAVNAALLSRTKVFHLEALSEDEVVAVLRRALADETRGLGVGKIVANDDALAAIGRISGGDARRALTTLELAAAHGKESGTITIEHVEAAAGERTLLHDKGGDAHYDIASAFIKSLRGSDPDASLYWMFRLLDAGDDPLFVARRMIIFASEDVGNADPRALEVAVNADAAFRRVGMPEGNFPLSHACLYLASCPKSDGVKRAMGAARALVADHGALSVPKKLRNAATKLAKSEGHGEGYRYPHEEAGHVALGETYLPDEIVGAVVYEPSAEGLEKAIGERLARLRGKLSSRDVQKANRGRPGAFECPRARPSPK